ncbi:general secretion pathway protein GspC [Marinobacter halodurans]|uniref:General secretion pathway protein GspC n=1 Tax=Marinobacter halodurans TaxID=2528979 RepID=A0ABY1ZKM7_9GAMM|nr:type II secretion system protein N [Marinobacter halodurans]TBW56015.1 general secretion pathway protein GspC [Marinobacter halodurans]
MTGIYSRLPQITALLLVVAMIASLGWQGWRFYQAEQARQAGSSAVVARQAPADNAGKPDVDLSAIDLFGKAGAQAAQQPQSTENLPETNLRLYLRGVMAGDENSGASALIEDANNDTEAYLIGDDLPGNATLRSVYPNRVIIERSGKLENLYFPETADSGIDLSNGSEGQTPESTPADVRPQPRAVQPPGSAPAVTSDRREEIRRRLEALRERLRQNSN